MNGLSLALQSGSILLREGIEAMLVIAALAAFLRRGGATTELKAIYLGTGTAILASVLAAIVFDVFLGGAHEDRLEAAVMLLASVLMLYTSGWLFLRQNPGAWNATLQLSARRAMSSGTSLSLALIAFLAVFREGGETVLFLHALARSSGGWNAGLGAGLIAATVCLLLLYGAAQGLAFRLPLRPVFLLTSAFLFLMGLRFIGGAIQELQEQAMLPYDSVTVPDWLVSLGVNPTWEALGVQLAVAVLAVGSILAMSGRHPVSAVAMD
ncbi:FTR1 family iron permease [Bradyrhizobium sp.]|uniref:FTR1 family iron permease n=1 Tax=Bradyrhizobium sp. TaxID=376 RepID=UPI0040377E5C